MTGPRLAILAYHKIGDPPPSGWGSWWYVPERTFADHLQRLRDGGWKLLDVASVIRGIAAPQQLPVRAGLITFDDAYQSVLDRAVPVLERFGARAVVFVPTAFVGETNLWDGGKHPQERVCDWDELRELAGRGISVQSHGVSHRRLSELAPREREREVVASKAELEQQLDHAVDLFSFPYGDDGDGTAAPLLERAGYRAAFLYGGGPFVADGTDAFRLSRLAMGPDTCLDAALSQPRDGAP